jgi:hypothetical protein
MAKIQFNSFNAGLVSDLFSARVDIKARFAGGRVVRDFIPTSLGPLVGRSGTIYQAAAYDSTKKQKLIGLNGASGTNYVVEMSEYLFRFWKSNALLSGSSKSISSVGNAATVTFTDTSAGSLGAGEVILVGWTSHDIPVGSPVSFTTSGTLPQGIVSGTIYYVHASNYSTGNFTIAATPYGSQITSDGTGNSGTHSGYHSILATTTAHGYVNDDVISINNDSGVTGLAAKWVVKNAHCAPVTVTSVDASANTFTVVAHGMTSGQKLYFSVSRTGAMPTGSSALTAYYAIKVTDDTFKISTTKDIVPVDISSTGSGTIRLHKADESFFNRFQVALIDGTLDVAPTLTTSGTTTVTNINYRHSTATNNKDWRSAGFTGTTTNYTGSGDSAATWYGKHHHYSEAVMYDASDRFDIGYAVLGDSIFFAHNASWPRYLKVNSDYDWDFTYHAYKVDFVLGDSGYSALPCYYDGPYVDLNTDIPKTVWPTLSLSSQVGTISTMYQAGGTTPILSASDVGIVFRIDGNASVKESAWYQVTSVNSWTNDATSTADFYAKVMASGSFSVGYYDFWRKGLFGTVEGYPNRVSFVQDRICYSTFNNYPSRIEMSESSAYDSFSPNSRQDYTEVNNDNAISFSIASQSVGKISWTLQSNAGMFVGATGGVFLVAGVDSALMIPGAVSQTMVSNYGAENIPPIVINGSVFYVEVGGRRIRQLVPASTGADSNNASRLFFDALNSPIIGWEFCRKGVPIIWCHLTDGTVVGVVAEIQDDVFAAFTVDIGGSFGGSNPVIESISSFRNTASSDELYFVVKRTINGSTVRYVERLADNIFFDAGVTKSNVICMDSAITITNGPASTTVSGLSHLEGQAVDVVADNIIITGKTVSSGAITLSTAAASIRVGLSYRPAWESLDIESPDPSSVSLGTVKRMSEIDVGLYNTLGAKVGRNSTYMNEFNFGAVTTTDVALYTGTQKGAFNGSHSDQPRVRIEQVIPMPICIQYIVIEGQGYG